MLLIVVHALHHVQLRETTETQPKQLPPVLTPELVSELRVLLAQTCVTEKHPETPQLTEATTGTVQEAMPTISSFPSITQEEKEKAITAFTQGIPKRKICSHLHWEGCKYTTTVKPALDVYSAETGREGGREEH